MTALGVLRRIRPPAFRADRSRDMFLASYPRSGNTWLRAILFEARVGRAPGTMAEIDLGIPDEHHRVSRMRVLDAAHEPRRRYIVKTHAPYRVATPYRDVAYIIRDPRDVIPSYFRYRSRKRGSTDADFEDFVRACLSGSIWPGSWYDHVRSWLYFGSRHGGHIGLFRFEDLVERNTAEIRRLGETLHLPDTVSLDDLFQRYDVERMRALEEAGNRKSERAPGFIGQGRAGAPQRDAVDAAIRRHAPHWIDLMAEFDYAV